MNPEKAQEMYEKLLAYAEDLHEGNRKRIHHGITSLFVLPVILLVIMLVTGSSRIVFLIVWVVAMFILAAYLISIAYIDNQLNTMINSLLEEEREYDSLMGYGPEKAQERFMERHNKLKKTVTIVREQLDDQLDGVKEQLDGVKEQLDGVKEQLGEQLDGIKVQYARQFDEQFEEVKAQLEEEIQR